jgi:hypothetical protein
VSDRVVLTVLELATTVLGIAGVVAGLHALIRLRICLAARAVQDEVLGADDEVLTLLRVAADESWRIDGTQPLRRGLVRGRVKTALVHPMHGALITENDRRGRLRDHQTYVPPDGSEIRYLEGAAAVTQTLQGTPPRGKTLDQLWERGNGDGAGTP